MPIRYAKDEAGIVRITAEGTTDAKDWSDAIDTMAQDSDFDPKRMLIDVSRHESVAPSDIMWKIGAIAGRQSLDARWALLVSRPVSEGMAMMLSTLVEKAGVRVQTFRSLEEAEAWLGEEG